MIELTAAYAAVQVLAPGKYGLKVKNSNISCKNSVFLLFLPALGKAIQAQNSEIKDAICKSK